MDKEWLERLRERGLTADTIFDEGQYEGLKKQLLANGGEAVILMGRLDNYDELVTKGFFRRGNEAKKIGGVQGFCHTNSEALAKKYPHYRKVTGFALDEDGVWRDHSWVINDRLDEILETTTIRKVYFGNHNTGKQ